MGIAIIIRRLIQQTYNSGLFVLLLLAPIAAFVISVLIVNVPSINAALLENEGLRAEFTTTSAGFMTMFMLLTATLSSKLIANERFSRTIHRIFISPATMSTYTLASYLVNLLIQLVQVGVFVAVSTIAGVVFAVPLYVMAVLLLTFAIFAAFFGMWIGSVSKNVNQMILVSQIVIMPGMLLCGMFFTFDTLPLVLQRVAFLFPQTWVTQAAFSYAGTLAAPYFAWMAGYIAVLCAAAGLVVRNHGLISARR